MKHLFVPYNLALQLKEKGFNENCFTWYLNKKLEEDSTKFFFFTHSYRSHKGEIFGVAQEFVSAPLYQQAIDWFREKHEILILTDHYLNHRNEFSWRGGYRKLRGLRENFAKKQSFMQTYNMALNKAIEEALKLI